MNCPNCGANLRLIDGKAVCEYCGYEELMPGLNGTASDAFFNLMVFNESITGTDLEVTIPDCSLGFIIRQGEAVAKDIPPGYHTIVVSAGGMTEYRSVLVPGDGKATKVFAAKAALGIAIRIEEPGSNRYAGVGMPINRLNAQGSTAILALIFSILVPLVGLVFCIIDTVQSKNNKKKLSPLTIVGYVFIGLRTLIVIFFLILSLFLSR